MGENVEKFEKKQMCLLFNLHNTKEIKLNKFNKKSIFPVFNFRRIPFQWYLFWLNPPSLKNSPFLFSPLPQKVLYLTPLLIVIAKIANWDMFVDYSGNNNINNNNYNGRALSTTGSCRCLSGFREILNQVKCLQNYKIHISLLERFYFSVYLYIIFILCSIKLVSFPP